MKTKKAVSNQTIETETLERVRRAAWKICRGPDDHEDTVQDMILIILEERAKSPSFAQQQPVYQVKRAYWRVQDIRRKGDRDRNSLSLDTPLVGDEGAEQTFYDLFASDADTEAEATRRISKVALHNALAALRDRDEYGAIEAELLVRRFYGEQTVTEAAQAMGMAKGTACWYSSKAFADLRQVLEAQA
jgi:DNA-directed RNA polymerase specialized sigma24 family protein